MKLWHATKRANLASIQEHGLLVMHADPTAKIKACWACTGGNRPWAIIHTQRKHNVSLEEVVIIEVNIPKSRLIRFKKGFYYTKTDIEPSRLGQVIPGQIFGQSLL